MCLQDAWASVASALHCTSGYARRVCPDSRGGGPIKVSIVARAREGERARPCPRLLGALGYEFRRTGSVGLTMASHLLRGTLNVLKEVGTQTGLAVELHGLDGIVPGNGSSDSVTQIGPAAECPRRTTKTGTVPD